MKKYILNYLELKTLINILILEYLNKQVNFN